MIMKYARFLNTSLSSKLDSLITQTESIFSVFNSLQGGIHLPQMNSWAISPDLAKLLIEIVLDYKPQVIVECGGGTSTIILGRMLQLQGKGKIFTIENFENSIDTIKKYIRQNDLENFVNIISAPLKSQTLGTETQNWYDFNSIPFISNIDLLFIDGPPQHNQPKGTLARYFALPFFYRHLKKGAVIILDDGARPAEKQIVKMWTNEFDIESRLIELSNRGVWLINKIR